MIPRGGMDFFPLQGIAETTSSILNPKKSVIIDQIMVQLISLIMIFLMVLIFNVNNLSPDNLIWILGGLFMSIFFLSSVYTRISY
jgi:hypothetical protein